MSDSVRTDIAALGQYFAFETHDSSSDASWRPLSTLLDDTGALVERYQQVQVALAGMAGVATDEIEFRVAASVAHLGIVARLLCPAFGAALLGWELDLRQAYWRPQVGGVLPLALPNSAIGPAVRRAFGPAPDGRAMVDFPSAILVERTAAMSVSRKVLWGNVASAVNGALTAVITARPDLADPAAAMAASILGHPSLADTCTGSFGADFRRTSCCLIYRIAPAGTAQFCGDCVLR